MAKSKLYWEKEKKRGEKGKKREKEKRKKKRKKEKKKRKKKKEREERWGKQTEMKKKHGGVSSDSIYFKSLDFPWKLSI